MSLLPLFEWLGRSLLGAFMQRSSYAFAAAEMLHLLGLAGLGGGVLMINLRVLGLGLTVEPAARLAKELLPYLAGCLATMAATGLMLVAAEPEKCYYNAAFRVKMALLVCAVVFSALAQRRWLERKAVAVISLLLWVGVGLAGRAIGVI
jgi:hypothetical protein